MKLFEELPTVLPFYTDKRNQNRFKENIKKNCVISLLSPKNAFLPFMIRLKKGINKPLKWVLKNDKGIDIDLSNNIEKLKAIEFEDFVYCYYNGEELSFQYETINQPLNLTGLFYCVLEFENIKYFSENFYMSNEIKHDSFSNRFIKILFSDQKDIEPLRYRHGFEQIIYLDTFIHTSEPEIEEEVETDGYNQGNPTFQKMIIKQKVEVYVPDFIKNALMSLQIHENVKVYDQNKREGVIDRTKVTASSDENGAFSTVQITFETDVLTKTQCDQNKQATNANLWV